MTSFLQASAHWLAFPSSCAACPMKNQGKTSWRNEKNATASSRYNQIANHTSLHRLAVPLSWCCFLPWAAYPEARISLESASARRSAWLCPSSRRCSQRYIMKKEVKRKSPGTGKPFQGFWKYFWFYVLRKLRFYSFSRYALFAAIACSVASFAGPPTTFLACAHFFKLIAEYKL